MSTSIKEVKGFSQKGNETQFGVDWVDESIYVNRFYGGDKGAMIQLTPSNGSYTMLTKKQVKKLIKVLSEAFDYDKYPSE